MERQALCDAVTRYNAEGIAGLYDRGGQGRPPALGESSGNTLLTELTDLIAAIEARDSAAAEAAMRDAVDFYTARLREMFRGSPR